jgi:hypothetical protein
MAVRKRDKAYSEEQLIRDHPAIYSDVIDAKYRTVTEAALAAGLKRPRTRLHELKNAWSISSNSEQLANRGYEQLPSKCRRLQEWDQLSEKIVPSSNEQMPLDIFLVLTSPKKSHQLKQLDWPTFVKLNDGVPFFLPLDMSAAPEFFYAPERCDARSVPSASGDLWRLNQVSRPLLDEF